MKKIKQKKRVALHPGTLGCARRIRKVVDSEISTRPAGGVARFARFGQAMDEALTLCAEVARLQPITEPGGQEAQKASDELQGCMARLAFWAPVALMRQSGLEDADQAEYIASRGAVDAEVEHAQAE